MDRAQSFASCKANLRWGALQYRSQAYGRWPGRLAIYLLEWMGKVQLLISLPFWFVARGIRAAGMSMQAGYRKRFGGERPASAPYGRLAHG